LRKTSTRLPVEEKDAAWQVGGKNEKLETV
jgi:hypothetical protein